VVRSRGVGPEVRVVYVLVGLLRYNTREEGVRDRRDVRRGRTSRGVLYVSI